METVSLDDNLATVEEIEVVSPSPESIEEVQVAIAQLPQGYRTVITLRLIEGYEYEEIAEILNIVPSSVRSQYTRAKQKLAKILKDLNHGKHG